MRALALCLLAVAANAFAQFNMAGPDMKMMVLMQPEAQKELKLTGEQKKAITKAMKDMSSTAAAGGMPDMANMDKPMLAVLTPEQATRLDELWVQYEGPCVLQKPEQADKLQLTPEQRTQVNTIWSDYGKLAMDTMMKQPASTGSVKEMKKKRAAANEATLALLTDTQKSAYAALEGKPIKWRAKKEF